MAHKYAETNPLFFYVIKPPSLTPRSEGNDAEYSQKVEVKLKDEPRRLRDDEDGWKISYGVPIAKALGSECT
ncbi:hypothetical protein CEXT_547101 [Caerostris extrusa]|uniref:Uncharacterized protein n=1 Tax=Caerostris extrusa TaxID=172846 RepID=A0AAV4UBD1_CAEEX|nr:hypothetical protein CEXT_547101 [Caerostris extrusa]